MNALFGFLVGLGLAFGYGYYQTKTEPLQTAKQNIREACESMARLEGKTCSPAYMGDFVTRALNTVD